MQSLFNHEIQVNTAVKKCSLIYLANGEAKTTTTTTTTTTLQKMCATIFLLYCKVVVLDIFEAIRGKTCNRHNKRKKTATAAIVVLKEINRCDANACQPCRNRLKSRAF